MKGKILKLITVALCFVLFVGVGFATAGDKPSPAKARELKEQPKQSSKTEQPKPEPTALTPAGPAQRTVEPATRTSPAEVTQAGVPFASAVRDKGRQIKWQVFSSGTIINGTSSKYHLSLAAGGEMDGSVGQLAASEGSSESYGVGSGFWQGIETTEPFIHGDANRDGEINLGDAIYLLNYLFKNGIPPNPLEAGDANCDGAVELGDVIYVLNYLFKNGPPPPC